MPCATLSEDVIDLTTSPVKSHFSKSLSSVSLAKGASEMYSNLPDSDSDNGVESQSKGDFYFHNLKWPVWSCRSEGLPSKQLTILIMQDASKQPDMICTSRPVGVHHNALFVIDLNSVQ